MSAEPPGAAHLVRIHIDRKPYTSPNPTTGEALYALAHVGKQRELFREVDGNHEDELVPRDHTDIRLHQDEHFYSQKDKDRTIIVNLVEKVWDQRRISYEEVTHLAYPEPPPPNFVITYTDEYEGGPRANPEGSLTVGNSVKVK